MATYANFLGRRLVNQVVYSRVANVTAATQSNAIFVVPSGQYAKVIFTALRANLTGGSYRLENIDNSIDVLTYEANSASSPDFFSPPVNLDIPSNNNFWMQETQTLRVTETNMTGTIKVAFVIEVYEEV